MFFFAVVIVFFLFCNASYYSMSLPLCVPPLKATTCKLPPVAMRYLLQCHTLLHSLATNILATCHNNFCTISLKQRLLTAFAVSFNPTSTMLRLLPHPLSLHCTKLASLRCICGGKTLLAARRRCFSYYCASKEIKFSCYYHAANLQHQ